MIKYPMLVVDKDIDVSCRQQAEWLKHGISTVRVNTMQEAIEKLTKESFLFTAINADTVNYLPLLKVMRHAAPTFIFIISTDYTTEKEVEALHNGADVYTMFNGNVELNVQLALAQLLRCNERSIQPKIPKGMLIFGGFLVLSDSRRIFYNDERVRFTKIEYDILCYLIENHDIPLSYDDIYNRVWGEDCDKSGNQSLWDYMRKIRKKLKAATGEKEYIVTERDMGYRFTTHSDK